MPQDYNTNDYLTILDNRVKDIFPVIGPKVKREWPQYAKQITDKQLLHTLTGVTALAMGEIIGDGQVPTSDAPIQGYTKTYTQQVFTKRLRLSMKAMYFLFENGQDAKIKGEVEKEVTSLKDAVVQLENYLAQSMIYNGNATSFSFTPLGGLGVTVSVDTTGIDGVAAFSASHPREDGGTAWSNIISSGTVNPVFSFTALMAARGQQSLKKDGRGLPLLGENLDRLLCQVNSNTHFLATSIKKTLDAGKYPQAYITGGALALQSPTSLVDGAPTVSYEIVPLAVYGGSAITSVTWALYDSTMVDDEHGLLYIESMPLQLISAQDAVGGLDYVKTAVQYCQFGFGDMRYWMWSNGTTA